MDDNKGIIATGGAGVWGNAVASGKDAHAEARVDGPVGAEQQSVPVEQIRFLLAALAEELRGSTHPERDELIEEIDAADAELAAEQPRTGKLKRFAAGLSSALRGFTQLAGLAAAVERAIHGL
jgi:hypothetical protein